MLLVLKKVCLIRGSFLSKLLLSHIGHHDASNEYTSVEDAVTATQMALEEGLGGVMTWDINRDCRSGYQS